MGLPAMTVKAEIKELTRLISIILGAMVIIGVAARSSYIDRVELTPINKIFILMTGLITACLYYLICEVTIHDKWRV